MKKLIRNQQGIALVTILVLLVLLSLIGSTALFSSNIGKKVSANYRYATDALQNADAGIADAARQILNKTIVGNGETGWTYAGSTTGFTNNYTVSYVVLTDKFGNKTIAKDSGGQPLYQIDAVGYSSGANGVERKIRAVIQLNSTGSPFNNGVFGKDWVHFNGNGYVDSYLGTWVGKGNRANGDSGSNGEIVMNGNGGIYGKAIVTDSNNVINHGSSAPTGGVVTGPEQNPLPKTAPTSGIPVTFAGTSVIYGGEYQVPGNVVLKNNITISGNVTMVIDGNLDIKGGNYQGQITIAKDSSLTLYVKGNIDISGKGIVNAADNGNTEAKNVVIYGTETCGNIKLSGQSTMYGVVYAPNADISFDGQGEIFGAVIGKQVSVSGSGSNNGGIHYDESLKNFGGGGGPPSSYKMLSWKEF